LAHRNRKVMSSSAMDAKLALTPGRASILVLRSESSPYERPE
jgi:hypothetical protein